MSEISGDLKDEISAVQALCFDVLCRALEAELGDPASELVLAAHGILQTEYGLSGISQTDVFLGLRTLIDRPAAQATEPGTAADSKPETPPHQTPAPTTPAAEPSTTHLPGGAGPYTLLELQARSKELVCKPRKPAFLLLPDGQREAVDTWTALTGRILHYLLSKDLIPPLPFSATRNPQKRIFLNDRPKHLDPKATHDFGRVQAGTRVLYYDEHLRADGLVNSTVITCQAVGFDPASIEVSIR